MAHAVALDWLDDTHTPITVVDPDGSTRSLTTTYIYATSSAVVGDTLVAYDDWSETGSPLTLIDLTTGADRTLDLPPAPAGLATWVLAIAEVSPTVALVHLMPAFVETECGGFDCVSTVGVVTERQYLLDLVTGAWTDLGEDVNFYPKGTRSDGVVLGRAYMPAGNVNVAWDPVADTWWVDEDTCVTPTTPGGVIVDDRLWTTTRNDEGTELTVTPTALSLD